MRSVKDLLGDWFGYTRRERRSTFILLNLVLVILGLRYIVPTGNISLKEIPIDLNAIRPDTFQITAKNKVQITQKKQKTFYRKKSPVDLNSCDSVALIALPGIGPVLSSRIIKYRNLIGGYFSVDQLKEVYGLPEETFNLVAPRLFTDSLTIRKISLNKAGYREIIRHPYFQKSEVNAIMKYRELKGRISGIGEMIENNLISPETARKIRPYLDFGE
jgi:DNA uptake protein ComE-like DNA-binding protein